jgi:hypothetical protein
VLERLYLSYSKSKITTKKSAIKKQIVDFVRLIVHYKFDFEVDGDFDDYAEEELESFARDMMFDFGQIPSDDYAYEVYEEVV